MMLLLFLVLMMMTTKTITMTMTIMMMMMIVIPMKNILTIRVTINYQLCQLHSVIVIFQQLRSW